MSEALPGGPPPSLEDPTAPAGTEPDPGTVIRGGHGAERVVGVVALSAVLYLFAGTGMAYVAGFNSVYERLSDANWPLLAVVVGAVTIGFCGYYMAYRGLYLVEDGPELPPRTLFALVAAGFGGLLAHGGGALDRLAVAASGAGDREAKVRVTTLAGFEHGILAAIVCPAAIAAVAVGGAIPRSGFTWPWALAPLPGFVVAVVAAHCFRGRLRDRHGILGAIGIFLDAIHLTTMLFRHPRRTGYAAVGMGLYWGADIFALWTTTTVFGIQMSALSVIVVYGTGMLASRRTAPLGGAGLLGLALVPSLWYVAGVPFAVATLGVFAYQFFTLWMPLPCALLVSPVLRALRRGEQVPGSDASGRR